MSMMMFTMMGVPPLAAAIYGVILDNLPVGVTLLCSGLALIVVAIAGLCSMNLRGINRI